MQTTRGRVRLSLPDPADRSDVIGRSDAVMSVEASPSELLRAVTGRRSRTQVSTFRWRNVDDDAIETVLGLRLAHRTPGRMTTVHTWVCVPVLDRTKVTAHPLVFQSVVSTVDEVKARARSSGW